MYPMALPAYSVDSEKEGRSLITLVTVRSYDGRQMLPGFLDEAERRSIDAIGDVSEFLAGVHERMKAGTLAAGNVSFRVFLAEKSNGKSKGRSERRSGASARELNAGLGVEQQKPNTCELKSPICSGELIARYRPRDKKETVRFTACRACLVFMKLTRSVEQVTA